MPRNALSTTLLALSAGVVLCACFEAAGASPVDGASAAFLDPSYRFEIESGGVAKIEREIAFLESKLELDSSSAIVRADLAAAHLRKARLHSDAEGIARARELARASLDRLKFANTTAYLVLAKIAQDEHDFDETLRLTDLVRTTDPLNSSALGLATTAVMGQGRPLEALARATQWVKTAPSPSAFAHRAVLFAAVGQHRDAVRDFARALELEQPGSPDESAWTRAAIARYLVDHGDLDRGRAFVREAVRIAPKSSFALAVEAHLAASGGETDRADTLYQQLFDTTGDGRWMAKRAAIAARNGEADLAASMWRLAERAMAHSHGDDTVGHAKDLAEMLLDRDNPGDRERALYLMLSEIARRQDRDTRLALVRALVAGGYVGRAVAELSALHRSGYVLPQGLASIRM